MTDREKLIEILKRHEYQKCYPSTLAAILIDNDVTVQKHGRWLGTHDGWYYSFSCSECGAEALTKEETMHDQVCSAYCPNCGAKMEEKHGEE